MIVMFLFIPVKVYNDANQKKWVNKDVKMQLKFKIKYGIRLEKLKPKKYSSINY